eukprot:6471158-Amphidinium_carterae.2
MSTARIPSGECLREASATLLAERKIVEKMTDAELDERILQLVQEKAVPKHYTRKNVGAAPKSVLLGLYTKRGLGLGVQTTCRLPLLAAVHELARRRPGCHAAHGYTSVMVNDNTALARHRDQYNFGVNYLYGVSTNGTGGQLWLSLEPEEHPLRVHPPLEYCIDHDWQGAVDAETRLGSGEKVPVASAQDAGLCLLETADTERFSPMTRGAVHETLGQWTAFDPRRAHGVLPFTPSPSCPHARRISITLFSPRRLEVVDSSLWEALALLEFPCADVRLASDVQKDQNSESLEQEHKSRPGHGHRDKRTPPPFKAVLLAAGLRHGNAQSLDGCWLRA